MRPIQRTKHKNVFKQDKTSDQCFCGLEKQQTTAQSTTKTEHNTTGHQTYHQNNNNMTSTKHQHNINAT